MTDKIILSEVLSKAVSTGADFAELYFEDKTELCIKMREDSVNNNAVTQMHGAGLYLLCGTQSLYGYTNDTSRSGLIHLAEKLSQMMRGTAASSEKFSFKEKAFTSPHKVYVLPQSATNIQRINLLREICQCARDESKKIIDVNGEYFDYIQNVTVANTEGVMAQERRLAATLRLYVTAKNGSVSHMCWGNFTYPVVFEDFRDQGFGETQAKILARRAVTMLDAEDVPSARVPVIIEDGTLIHEACGHSMEGTKLADGSQFYGKVGQKVASDKVTIIDDGTMPGLMGSCGMDDEGTPMQKNILIENGILKGYMSDRLSSRKLGIPMTGSGRRQSYRFAPCSRMTNTYMLPGNDDADEMLSSVSEGLYVKQLGGGNTNPLTGNFNIEVAEGYWISSGKLIKPVKGINLSGNGIEVLKSIDRVSPKIKWDVGGLCGADSGLVYVTASQPRARISSLMVAGKDKV